MDPKGYAAAKAKESYKKEKQLAASGADMAIRKLLATPVEKVDVAHAMLVIEEAEAQGVLASLIDKAAMHTERAIEEYMNE